MTKSTQHIPPDWRGLCELVDDLREQASQGYCEFISREDLRRAADLLEQLNVTAQKPESDAVAPSDEELLELAQHHSVSYTMSDGTVVYPLQHGCDMRDDVLSFARAVLTRAADLLERQAVPVAVSERLPGAEDCDAEGRCWWFLPTQQLEILRQCDSWSFRKHTPFPYDVCRWTHWLPAHALPVPSGEVE